MSVHPTKYPADYFGNTNASDELKKQFSTECDKLLGKQPEDIKMLVESCLLGRVLPSPDKLKGRCAKIEDVTGVINFVDKMLSQAAGAGIVPEESLDFRRNMIFNALQLQFQSPSSSTSPETAILDQLSQKKFQSVTQFLSALASIKKSPDFAHLTPQQKDKFVVEALKRCRFLTPENLQETIAKLRVDNKESKLELIRHLLFLYPEEMAFKIENFKELADEDKFSLFKELLAMHPRMISNWKAAFMLKTRERLAQNKLLVDVLITFDQVKDEKEALKLAHEKLGSSLERDFIGTPLGAMIGSSLQRETSYFRLKEAVIFWAFVIDHFPKENLQENIEKIVAVEKDLNSLENKVRIPLIYAMLSNPEALRDDPMQTSESPPRNLLALDQLNLPKHVLSLMEGMEPKMQRTAIGSLLFLELSPSLTTSAREELLRQFENSHSAKDLYEKIQSAYCLLYLTDCNYFNATLSAGGDVRSNFAKAMMDALPGIEMTAEDFAAKFANTFGSYRIPEAIPVYIKCLQELPKMERGRVLSSVSSFVSEVFKEEHKSKRYHPSTSPHLASIASSHPNLYDLWQRNDVRGPIAEFLKEEPRLILQGCTLQETDDAEELALCTTEVAGSCLSVRGQSQDNKSFISYPIDGKNKLYSIQNEEGVMIGRAILRLLTDEEGSQVLLLDTFFSSLPYAEGGDRKSPYEQCAEAIVEAARRKAEILGVPLLKTYSDGDSSPAYPQKVLSQGGRAPFECCNAVGAQGDDELCPESKFTINKTQVIFSPFPFQETVRSQPSTSR